MSYNLSWFFSWWISLAVVLNLAENRSQGAWRRSALCNVPRFFINLGVQRCIQSLVKHRRRSSFVKRAIGVLSYCALLVLTVFAKDLSLRCLSPEYAFGVF